MVEAARLCARDCSCVAARRRGCVAGQRVCVAVYLWLRGWVAVGVAMCLWGRAAVAVTAWLRSCVAMWLDGVISEHGQQKCNGGVFAARIKKGVWFCGHGFGSTLSGQFRTTARLFIASFPNTVSRDVMGGGRLPRG